MKEREDCNDIVLCVYSLYDFDTPTLQWECNVFVKVTDANFN